MPVIVSLPPVTIVNTKPTIQPADTTSSPTSTRSVTRSSPGSTFLRSINSPAKPSSAIVASIADSNEPSALAATIAFVHSSKFARVSAGTPR